MTKTVSRLLGQYTENQGVYTNPPLSKECTESVYADLMSVASERFADEYLELLLFSNGVQIDNAVIFDAEELREHLEPSVRFIEFGQSGNLDAFIFCPVSGEYRVVNFYDHQEVFEASGSLVELLGIILSDQGIEVTES